ncbi:MAG: ketopantoate reductase family protein [Lautropia sp.]
MTTTPSPLPRTAVVGAGGVGCYFGAMLAKAGAEVTLIGRAAPMAAIAANGLQIVGKTNDRVRSMATATALEAARGARLVLLCTKTTDTVATAQALASIVDEDADIVSLQNGVDNVERIFDATGRRAIPAAVYVAVEVSAPGVLAHHGRGDLAIGAFRFDPSQPTADAQTERVARIAAAFESAGVPCRQSADIRVELWTKLVMNCAVNAISALGQAPYGRMATYPVIREMIAGLANETVAVARAHGIPLPPDDFVAAAFKLIDSMPGQYASTTQDIRRGRPTEIDALNGHVAALAERHGVDAPLNRWLAALVRLRESGAADGQPAHAGAADPEPR